MRSDPATRLFLTALFGLALWLGPQSVEAVVIDFEALPGADGVLGTPDDVPIVAPALFIQQPQQITDQFASLGILFNPNPPRQDMNEILNDSTFSRTVGSARNLLSTSRSAHPSFGPIEAMFTVPVRELTMAIGLGPLGAVRPNILLIFDADGNVIDSIIGSDEFVTLSSPVDIASFLVRATNVGSQAAIDDITFEAVPEPSTLALLGLGIVGLVLRWRRD